MLTIGLEKNVFAISANLQLDFYHCRPVLKAEFCFNGLRCLLSLSGDLFVIGHGVKSANKLLVFFSSLVIFFLI